MMDEPLVPLNKSTIDAVLQARVSGMVSVEVLQETESTNTRLSAAGAGQTGAVLSVCAAEHQTKGRGRRGKTWHTPNRGVTFSMRFKVPSSLAEVSGLSLLAGAAVCDCLRQYCAAPVRVKWPNDILVGDYKLVGILVEVADHDASSTTVVIGIGVNYRRGAEAKMIDQQSTDLYEQCNAAPPDRSALIGSLVAHVYNSCCGDVAANVAELAGRWGDYDAFQRRLLQIHAAGEQVSGTSAGIDDVGQLRVATEAGVRVFSSADVSVRKV